MKIPLVNLEGAKEALPNKEDVTEGLTNQLKFDDHYFNLGINKAVDKISQVSVEIDMGYLTSKLYDIFADDFHAEIPGYFKTAANMLATNAHKFLRLCRKEKNV